VKDQAEQLAAMSATAAVQGAGFNAIDANRDGVITRQEFNNALAGTTSTVTYGVSPTTTLPATTYVSQGVTYASPSPITYAAAPAASPVTYTTAAQAAPITYSVPQAASVSTYTAQSPTPMTYAAAPVAAASPVTYAAAPQAAPITYTSGPVTYSAAPMAGASTVMEAAPASVTYAAPAAMEAPGTTYVMQAQAPYTYLDYSKATFVAAPAMSTGFAGATGTMEANVSTSMGSAAPLAMTTTASPPTGTLTTSCVATGGEVSIQAGQTGVAVGGVETFTTSTMQQQQTLDAPATGTATGIAGGKTSKKKSKKVSKKKVSKKEKGCC